uniref:Uncharacterized protein n=1 Tax=Panagrolaimus superbus TaxID=310955 RepID=A0A914YAE4_9BILA
MDSNICNETDVGDKTANAYPYLKSPWGFHSVYNVQQEPIEIVRCCKGNFCNHFGMFGDDKTDAWPTKFQFKMNEDWALSEEKVPEIQSFLGGRDFVKNPLYRAVPRKDANFTGLLPFEPMFCFYGGIPYSQAFNRSGMIYAPRMVFGCQINESFKIDFTASPEFNSQVQLYQQNVLRELKKQFLPFSTCHSTNGASIELLSFLRSNKKEKLVWFPICFAMIYRDFHQTFYRSGACALGESCCDYDYWTKSFFDLDKHNYNATTKTYEGKPYENSTEHVYKCTSPWCVSDEMDARCFFYSGKEYTAAEIVSKLNYGNFSNDMYPQRMGRSQVSLSVDSITGYNPSNFNQNKRKREFTAIDTYCTASDSCFANDSIFYQSHVSSAFPFCIWSTQRQYGADYSREVVVADASNKPDRIRFELGCKFDNGKSTAIKQLTSTADATDDDYQRKVLKSSKNRSSKKDL